MAFDIGVLGDWIMTALLVLTTVIAGVLVYLKHRYNRLHWKNNVEGMIITGACLFATIVFGVLPLAKYYL